MLDPKVFAKTIQKLREYYPKFELIEEKEKDGIHQITTWYKFFQDYDYDQFMYVVQNFINTSSYQPQSPAHLKNSVYKHVEIPPKWLIKQIMIDRNQKQLEHNEEVSIEETQKLLDEFK